MYAVAAIRLNDFECSFYPTDAMIKQLSLFFVTNNASNKLIAIYQCVNLYVHKFLKSNYLIFRSLLPDNG